ncbi:MAG TPA: peptidylprolyl isomerase, partial [Gemmatimonadaceae bacterium]|nr:peptidylprolyl isomerase [Gemmatimonadaceae bacterium]
ALAPRLRALLADPDSAVAANAAFALGLLRDSASIAALSTALGGPPTVGAEAAWALGAIGAPAWPAITSALAMRVARAPRVTAALLIACARMRPVPAATVIPWLAADSAAVRWGAVYAFARPYAPGGVRAVLGRTHDPDAEVRALVARALAHQAAGDSLAPRALPALDTLSRDPAEHVRVNALRSLGTYGPAARAAVQTALRDPDANVRITAAQALGAVMAGAADRAAWSVDWQADTSLMFRRAVLISAMSDGVVLPAADDDDPDAWVHLPDWRYRAAVADAGGASPDVQRVREIALPLTRDPDPRVRTAAFAAFAPFADSDAGHAWRREFMYFALTDPDAIVRATAIGALSAHATAAEAARVLAGYSRSAADTLNDARLATVALIRSAWQNDSAHFGDSLRAAIRALPVPPDQLTRDAARGFALLAAWSAAPPPPLPPLAWYEQVVRTLVLPALAGHEKSAEIATARGTITIRFAAVDAPLTVQNFLTLARSGWYDAVRWHRVVPAFVAQDGDRRGDGNGGPGTILRDELDRLRYARGVVGMALSGPDTGGSQYFITLTPQPHLDAGYTAFARVTAGWDALDATVQGDAITSVRIIE